jgi:AsmA-like C-terminal region
LRFPWNTGRQRLIIALFWANTQVTNPAIKVSIAMTRMKSITRTIFLLLLAISVVALLLNGAANYAPVQRYLIKKLTENSGHTIEVERLNISFVGGLGISGRNPEVYANSGTYRFHAARIKGLLTFSELLKGRLQPTDVEILAPEITLQLPQSGLEKGHQDEQGKPLPDTGQLETQQTDPHDPGAELMETLGKLKSLNIKNARISIVGKNLEFQEVDAKIRSRSEQTHILDMEINGKLTDPGNPIPFSITGAVDVYGNTMERPFFLGVVEARKVPLARLPQTQILKFQNGNADTSVQLRVATRENIEFGVTLSARKPEFTVGKVEKPDAYYFDRMHARLQGRLDGKVLHISSSTLGNDAFQLNTTAQLDFSQPANPDLKLMTTAPAMPLKTFKEIFPVSLLREWLQARLFPVFSGGEVTLREFSLDGSVARIARLGRPENRDVLALRLELRGLNAFETDGGLPIGSITGRLDIAGGRLSAEKISGRFGTSVIHAASLEFPDLYAAKKRFIIALDGDYELADLHQQQKIKMLPKVVRKVLSSFETMQGNISAHVNMTFVGPKWLPEITDSHLTSKRLRLARGAWVRDVETEATEIRVNSTGLPRLKAKGKWGVAGFDITAKGLSPWRPLSGTTWNAWTTKLDFSAPLGELTALAQSAWLPTNFSRSISEFDRLDGQIEGLLHISRAPEAAFPVLESGTLHLSEVDLVHKSLGLPLFIDKGDITIKSGNETQFQARGKWGNSDFEAKGSCDSKCQDFRADISTQARSAELLALWDPKKRLPLKISDLLPAQVKISRRENKWSYSGTMGLGQMQVRLPALEMTPPGNENELTFDIRHTPGEQYEVRQLRFSIDNSILEFSGAPTELSTGKFLFNVSAAPVYLSELGIRFNNADDLLDGVLNGSVQCRLDWSRESAVSLIGPVTIRDPIVKTRHLPFPIRGDLLSVAFEDQTMNFKVENLKLKSNTIQASGQLTGWRGLRGNVNIQSQTLDLSDLIANIEKKDTEKAAQPSDPAQTEKSTHSVGPFVQNCDIALSLRSPYTTWRNIPVGHLDGAGRFKSGNLDIDHIRLDTANGQLRMRGHIKTTPLPEQFYIGRVKTAQQPVESILRALGIPDGGIEGEVTVDGLFTAKGTKKDDLLSGLTGGVNIEVVEGQVPDPNLALKILNFLSLQKVFIRKPPNIAEEGFYFESIKGHVSLKNGIAETGALILKSPVFNAVTRGEANLIDRHVGADIAVQPLGTLDWMVSKIPIIGHILTGKDKSLLVYYFRAEGPFDQIDIDYVPFKNLAENTAGYFKRIIFTPERILKKISSLPEELKNLGVPIEPGDLRVLEDMEGP